MVTINGRSMEVDLLGMVEIVAKDGCYQWMKHGDWNDREGWGGE